MDVSSLELNAPPLILPRVSRAPNTLQRESPISKKKRGPTGKTGFPPARTPAPSLGRGTVSFRRQGSRNGPRRNGGRGSEHSGLLFLSLLPRAAQGTVCFPSVSAASVCANPRVKISFSEMCHIVGPKPPAQQRTAILPEAWGRRQQAGARGDHPRGGFPFPRGG